MNPESYPFNLKQLPYEKIDATKVCNDEPLFFVLASASLIESGSHIYTHILLNYFSESETGLWLSRQWEPEELQHGRALRKYIETIWPEFDWSQANENFLAEYSGYCSVEQLEKTNALELIARCVIETGTCSLYRSIYNYTDEPVLKQLAHLIRRDETRHYKFFLKYFTEYNKHSRHGRWPIFNTLVRRLLELRNEDADCALRHVFAVRYPEKSTESEDFRTISRRARELVINNTSYEMMVKMIFHPLQLPAPLRNITYKPCANIIRHFMVS